MLYVFMCCISCSYGAITCFVSLSCVLLSMFMCYMFCWSSACDLELSVQRHAPRVPAGARGAGVVCRSFYVRMSVDFVLIGFFVYLSMVAKVRCGWSMPFLGYFGGRRGWGEHRTTARSSL